MPTTCPWPHPHHSCNRHPRRRTTVPPNLPTPTRLRNIRRLRIPSQSIILRSKRNPQCSRSNTTRIISGRELEQTHLRSAGRVRGTRASAMLATATGTTTGYQEPFHHNRARRADFGNSCCAGRADDLSLVFLGFSNTLVCTLSSSRSSATHSHHPCFLAVPGYSLFAYLRTTAPVIDFLFSRSPLYYAIAHNRTFLCDHFSPLIFCFMTAGAAGAQRLSRFLVNMREDTLVHSYTFSTIQPPLCTLHASVLSIAQYTVSPRSLSCHESLSGRSVQNDLVAPSLKLEACEGLAVRSGAGTWRKTSRDERAAG